MSAPLSKKQKGILSDMAAKCRVRERRFDMTVSEYRHGQVAAAVGHTGLRSCSQDDYQILKSHFEQILGRHGAAFNSLVQHHTNGLRVAQFKLLEALELAGLNLSYAEEICQDKFKCSLEDAKEDQLWKIKYDVDRQRGWSVEQKEVYAC